MTEGIVRTINNAPTSNTKQAAQNGDLQHMLAMMQSPITNSTTALDRIAEKTGNLNNIVSGSAPATTQSFMNTAKTTTAPAVNASALSAVNNATVAPATTMQQELADMQAAAPATTQPATQATTTQTTQTANPTVTVSAPSVNSHENYLNDLYAAQREAALSALEAEYNAAIGDLERQKAALGPAYQSARNQTAGVNAQESRAMNEIYNAAGLSSGGRVQGAIAQSNVLQSELGALQQAEAQALAEIESQRTQVSAQYQAQVREAIMNNEMQKAAALYEEAIRYDNAMTSAAKESAKENLNAAKEKAEMLASIGDFSGYLALGYTPEQVAAFEAAYIEATKPKYTGGGTPVVKEPTLSLAEAKALAAEGDLSANVLATLYANGWTDANINAMYGTPTPTPTPTPTSPPTTQQAASDTVITTPVKQATPVGENPYGSTLKSGAAQGLYTMIQTGAITPSEALDRIESYSNKNQLFNGEAEYLLASIGF